MGDALASPGDPVFYVHHAWVDKIWWDWQEVDPDNRMYAIGGPIFQSPDIGFPEVPGNVEEEEANIFGEPSEAIRLLQELWSSSDPSKETTLEHNLTLLGIIPDITISKVMDTRGGYLCYEYV